MKEPIIFLIGAVVFYSAMSLMWPDYVTEGNPTINERLCNQVCTRMTDGLNILFSKKPGDKFFKKRLRGRMKYF